MTTEPTTSHGKAPTSPVLTAQRSGSHRIQYGVILGALTLAVARYGAYPPWREFYSEPTTDHLIIAVLITSGLFSFLFLTAKFTVPKVEFFENHLVARSFWGFSRKRSYQGIIKVKVEREHLHLMFYGGEQIVLSREEILFEDLALWLTDRGVTAARDLKRGTSEDWGAKQETVQAGNLQSKATPGPVLTVQASRSDRIQAFLVYGVPVLLSVYALGVLIVRYLNDPKNITLFVIFIIPVAAAVLLYLATLVLFPKVEFFENYIVERSQWARSRKRRYQEVVHLQVDYESLSLAFNDGWLLSIPRTSFRTEPFIRWLAERGVAAARDFKWAPPPNRSSSHVKIFKI